MENSNCKLDFPNPIEHIDIGDKPIKLKELSQYIENQEITVIFSKTIEDFKTFADKISAGKECLILEKRFWGFCALKRYAKITNKPIIMRVDSKKQNTLIKRIQFAKHVKFVICLNHKPYYYIAGCKCKAKEFDIGWTVIGVNILKNF